MTAPAEARRPGSRPDGPLDPEWRRAAAQAQRAAIPSGRVVLSCTAPLGSGGLGRHLGEILAAAGEDDASSTVCICGSTRVAASGSRGGAPRHALGIPYLTKLLRAVPALPASAGVRTRASMLEFDAYAAQQLPEAEHLLAFNSQALTQFRTARRAGYESVSLVSANSHLRRLARQHTLARRQYPLEGSWATRLLERNLAEYEQADRIFFSSKYIRDSFLEEGFAEEALVHFPLTPDPRYAPEDVERRRPDRFEIVYVGSLSVHKGVPLLIDAVRRLAHLDLGLRLVGGWGAPGVRRFVQRACAEDARISVCPGDPLPHLRAASLCVHPAYEDGFAYAPAEALAAGVPVIVSEDTGMKELIDPGRDGLIVATGDLDALTQSIEAAYRGEVLGLHGARAGDD
jgi:glycosyltransferase involved in cell wall biosynthesis